MKIGTHDNSFHEDDVFSVACMLLLYPEAEVIRTRDDAILDQCDIVIDVGRKYDGVKYFDHHMNGSPVRPDGVDYSSAGLIWKAFGHRVAPKIGELIEKKYGYPASLFSDPAFAEDFTVRVVDVIDYIDNGHSFGKLNISMIRAATQVFNPSWCHANNKQLVDMSFMNAVEYMQNLFCIEFIKTRKYLDNQQAESIIRNSDEASQANNELKNNGIIELPQWLPCIKYLCNTSYNFVIFPKDEKWGLRCIPPEPKSYDKRIPIPEKFAGLSDAELINACGIPGAIFCHKKQFVFFAKNREACIEMAKIAIKENKRI